MMRELTPEEERRLGRAKVVMSAVVLLWLFANMILVGLLTLAAGYVAEERFGARPREIPAVVIPALIASFLLVAWANLRLRVLRRCLAVIAKRLSNSRHDAGTF